MPIPAWHEVHRRRRERALPPPPSGRRLAGLPRFESAFERQLLHLIERHPGYEADLPFMLRPEPVLGHPRFTIYHGERPVLMLDIAGPGTTVTAALGRAAEILLTCDVPEAIWIFDPANRSTWCCDRFDGQRELAPGEDLVLENLRLRQESVFAAPRPSPLLHLFRESH